MVLLSGTVSGIAANCTFNVTVTDNGVTQDLRRDRERGRHQLERDDPRERCHGLANGTATVSAQVTDANGNQATASQTVTVAETRPDGDDCRGRRQQRHQPCRGDAAGGALLAARSAGLRPTAPST